MYCEHCKVEIEGAARNCPLCHAPLQSETQRFPQVKRNRRINTVTFGLVYLIFSLVAGLACVLVNAFVPSKIWWSIPVLALLAYIYILIGGTIISKRHTASKIFFQTISLAVLAGFLQDLTPNIKWAANYAVPIVILLGGLTLGAVALAVKKAGSYVMCLLLVALTGLIPICYCLILKEPVLWPSIVCAAGCGGILITLLMCGIFAPSGLLRSEIRRKFHT